MAAPMIGDPLHVVHISNFFSQRLLSALLKDFRVVGKNIICPNSGIIGQVHFT